MKENKANTNGAQNYSAELMGKAEKIMLDYNQATGSGICIYDSACTPVFPDCENCGHEKTICSHCVKFHSDREIFPCHDMHKNAILEANKKGGSHVYQCSMGFVLDQSNIH